MTESPIHQPAAQLRAREHPRHTFGIPETHRSVVGGRHRPKLRRSQEILPYFEAFLISIFCCLFATSAGFGKWMCNTLE